MRSLRFTAAVFALGCIVFSQCAPTVLAAKSSSSSIAAIPVNHQNDTPTIGDFTLAPTRFVLPMNPGDTKTVEVQLTNRSGYNDFFDLYPEDFIADPNLEGTPTFFAPSLSGPFSARAWMSTSAPSVKLNHGDRAFIPVTIKVPKNAEPGDHQVALILERRGAVTGKSGISVVSRLAALFIITIPGDIKQSGDVQSFWTNHIIHWFLHVPMFFSVKNDGSVHMNINGTIRIRNLLGATVDEIPLKDWLVLRASSRTREIDWAPRFAFGRYTASLEVSLNPNQPGKHMTVSFWVIPLLPTIIVLLAIFVVSYAVQFFFSRFEIRKKDEENGKKSSTKKS